MDEPVRTTWVDRGTVGANDPPIEDVAFSAAPPAAPFVERRSSAARHRVRPPTPRVALLLLAALAVGSVLYLGRDALGPFIVGLLLVFILDPAVERLSRLGIPRTLAILVVYIVVGAVVIEGLSLMLAPLVDQVSDVTKNLPTLARSLDEQIRRLSETYRGLNLPPVLRSSIDRAIADAGRNLSSFDPTALLPVFGSVASLIGSIFGYLIIPVWAFYLLKDRPQLTAAFNDALPAEWRADVWTVIHIAGDVLSEWARGQLVLGASVGIATFGGLMALGAAIDPIFSRYALLLAIIAGLFELLPIIGPILSAIPAILLAATAGLQSAIAAFLLYFAVQQLENNLLVPKIQGDAVRLHPSVVMFALIVGGAIAGLLGAILALPITAAGRDVFAYLFGRLSRPVAETAS